MRNRTIRGFLSLSLSLSLAAPAASQRAIVVDPAGGGDFRAIQPAIATAAGEVELDPTAALLPASGQPPVSGPASVVQRELASLAADTTGSRLTIDLHGPSGADYVIVSSLPAASLGTVFGDLWVAAGSHVVVDFGTLGSERTRTWSLDHPAIPAGFTISVQAVVLTTQFALSTPSVVAFP